MKLNLNMNYLQMRRIFVAKEKTPSYDKEEIKNRREQRNQKKVHGFGKAAPDEEGAKRFKRSY